MKKIIELAQIFLSMCVQTWSYDKDTGRELAQALEKRLALEQTPITEEWLKEHGWERNEIVFHGWSKTFEVGIREFATLILVNCYNEGWYVNDTPIRVNTLSDLYDACELCGINLED